MEKVLDHARKELDDVGPMKFNILRVIENAGVSRSSVYHHFGGRDGVIAAVEVKRMREETELFNLVLRQTIETVESRQGALDAIRGVLIATGSEAGRKLRAHRVAVIATAQNIPLLAETMRSDQRIVDEELRVILHTAVERGLVSPIANVEGLVQLIASLFIGRSAVDILEDEEADAAWVEATMTTLGYLMPPVD